MGVRAVYQSLLDKGYSAKAAAKEAQQKTGYSVVTGKPIKQRGPKHKTKRKWVYGEYE